MVKEVEKLDQELQRLVSLFEEAELNQRDSRKLSMIDRDYYDNKQWTDEEIDVLQKRRQPIVTINRIKPKIDFMLGLERTSRNDPKALARTPNHEADAAAVTDIMRFLETRNNFDDTRSMAFKHFSIEGTAAAKVEVHAIEDEKGKTKDFNIEIKPLHWDRIFWDPHSRREDFSDCAYRGEVIIIDADMAKAMFPGNDDLIESAFLSGDADVAGIFGDKPNVVWADKNRKRIRIVEMWYRKGKEIHHAIFTSSGFIEKPKRTPYRNDLGIDEDPYIFRSAFVDREGGRYGHVRQLISIQDEINKRRSKALHLMSVRQTRISRNSEVDTSKLRKELARPDGVIRAETDEFEVLPTGDMAQAQFALLSDAQTQIEQVGTNSALQGKFNDKASGKALQARAASGAVEINPLFDGMRMWQRSVFKKAWNRVREFWTEEKFIRVTDDIESPRFMLLNREKHTVQEIFEKPENVDIIPTPIPEMDVDIIIREGRNDILAQQEQFEAIAQLLPSISSTRPEMIPEMLTLLLEMSEIRPQAKEKLLAQLRVDPNIAAQQAQLQQLATELELADKQAKVDNTNANAAKKRAEAEKAQVEAIIKQLKPLEDI